MMEEKLDAMIELLREILAELKKQNELLQSVIRPAQTPK